MKTHHSILYIVLINSYDHRFIENITLSILIRHKNSRVGESWNFDDIGKIITRSSKIIKNVETYTVFWFVSFII